MISVRVNATYLVVKLFESSDKVIFELEKIMFLGFRSVVMHGNYLLQAAE